MAIHLELLEKDSCQVHLHFHITDVCSFSFKRKSIIKSANGLWRLTPKEPDAHTSQENPSPLTTTKANDTLRLRSATPSRRRLLSVGSREPSLSPPAQRRQREATTKRQAFSPPFRRPAINMDMWAPQPSHSPDRQSHGHIPPPGWGSSTPSQQCLNANPRPDHHSHSPAPSVVPRSNIDRYVLSHQGRTCVSSVDAKVTVVVPKNGAARPAYLMMQVGIVQCK